nr:MAG TPA: hypothetical protein [Caudoviricetes sp.]
MTLTKRTPVSVVTAYIGTGGLITKLYHYFSELSTLELFPTVCL